MTNTSHQRAPSAHLLLLAFGIATSGILMTPNLPVVGTKLAPPDLPLILFVLLTAALVMKRPVHVTNSMRLVLLTTGLFIWHAALSAVWSATHGGGVSVVVSLANYLYGAAILVSVMAVVRSFQDLEFLLKVWMVGGLLVAGVAVLSLAGVGPDWAYHGSRIKSTLRGVNQMQSYLAPVLTIAIFMLFTEGKSKRLICLLVVLIPTAAIALLSTGSRSSFLFLFICFLSIIFYTAMNSRKHPVQFMLFFAGLAACMFLGFKLVTGVLEEGREFLPDSARAVARPIQLIANMAEVSEQEGTIEALGPRGRQFKLVSEHWHENPLLGVGPGNFKQAFQHDHEVHNTYLGVLMEHGAVGLAIVLLLFASVFGAVVLAPNPRRNNEKIIRILICLLLLLLFAYGITNFGLRQRVLWITLGLSLAAVRLLHETPSNRHTVRSVGYVVGGPSKVGAA